MMWEVWKKQFTREKLLMTHARPHVFFVSQWQKKTGPSVFYLAYRWAMTIFFFATWLLSVIDPRHLDESFRFRVKWLVYLTNWGYTMCTFQSLLCAAMLTGWFFSSRKAQGNLIEESRWITCSYKLYWATNIIATDIAFGITILYWALIYDADLMPLDAQNIFVHATNAVAMLIELCMVAHPMRLIHCYWPVLFGLLYVLFSVVFFAAGGTSRHGHPFIYPVLDWRRPGVTVIICLGVLFFILFLHCFSCGVYWLRRYAHKKLVLPQAGSEDAFPAKREFQGGFDNVAVANDIV